VRLALELSAFNHTCLFQPGGGTAPAEPVRFSQVADPKTSAALKSRLPQNIGSSGFAGRSGRNMFDCEYPKSEGLKSIDGEIGPLGLRRVFGWPLAQAVIVGSLKLASVLFSGFGKETKGDCVPFSAGVRVVFGKLCSAS